MTRSEIDDAGSTHLLHEPVAAPRQPPESGPVVVLPPREVDAESAGPFEAEVRRACAGARPGQRVVLDFSAATFCDLAAVDVLQRATAAAHASGCVLRVHRPPRSLRRMAEVLSLSAPAGIRG